MFGNFQHAAPLSYRNCQIFTVENIQAIYTYSIEAFDTFGIVIYPWDVLSAKHVIDATLDKNELENVKTETIL